ncbi:adenosylcobinamide-GDP ribazoletransferase [uncultured Tateyamaria sp.]|uniref:adenosylcobinamide-GDP ribazoletransferase n=1 Tax=uncultured Tateyamaria sp. TaxID=455651 RepID=UPI0026356AED|nr:adenosylcobinamide-GDP ribazoletransferase [uncultured Tateyamaria sp.]
MGPKETDIGPVSRVWDLPVALVLLTRLPLPHLPDHVFGHGASAVWAYPLVGAILGLIVSALAAILSVFGLPPAIIAGLSLAALVILTGAMHEDGLADSADGLWGGFDPARRLEIMKDSRIGAYGVLALILGMGLRWLGFAEVTWTGLITALVVSRAMMPVLMHALPHAREDGLARSVGAPDMLSVGIGVGLAALCALICAGGAGLVALIIAALVTALIGGIAKAKLGGQTGDILGATQVITEIAVLLTLIALTQ